jgi:hypothetical protein
MRRDEHGQQRTSWHVLQLVDVRSRLSPTLSLRRRSGPESGGENQQLSSVSVSGDEEAKAAPTYSMETMGCQMNVADSERMEGQLRAMGYRRGEQGSFAASRADLVILNTCSIRDHAEQKVRRAVRAMVHCAVPSTSMSLFMFTYTSTSTFMFMSMFMPRQRRS